MTGKDTPLRRWRVTHNLTQGEAGELLAKQLKALGKPVRGVGRTAFGRFELYDGDEPPPSWMLQALKELTNLPYEALVEPDKFPELYREGKRPLQDKAGYPAGRPRGPRKHTAA